LTQGKHERAISAGETAGERHQRSTARTNELLPDRTRREEMMSVIARQLGDWLQERNEKSAPQNPQRLKWQPIRFSTHARERSNAVKITLGPKAAT
jgi:hypothetical protein